MKCLDKKKLSAYLDGELDEHQMQMISSHLEDCPKCRKAAEEFSTVTSSLDVLEDLEPDPYFVLQIKKRLDSRKPVTVWRRVLFPALAAATTTLSIVLGGFLGQLMSKETNVEPTSSKTELAEFLGTSPAEDFPDGSFGEIIDEVLVENGGNS